MVVIGIDPGTGLSSPTGLVIYNDESEVIIWFGSIGTEWKKQPTNKRIQLISKKVEEIIGVVVGFDTESLICIENFVMRGKGGETLQMLIGAIISRMPPGSTIMQPYNTTVKKVVGGTGKAEKPQVAEGVLAYFKDSPSSVIAIKELISTNQWDILDALAIGITGTQQYEENPNGTKTKPKNRPRQK